MTVTGPEGVDLETLRDFADWHVQNGRGKDKVVLDQRGLSFLEPKHHANIQIGLPPPEETHADGRVFLRAVF